MTAALAAAKTNVAPFERKRPARKPLPEHLPRERVVIAAPEACPCCGSDRLCKLGEDITETLEVVPRQWKVIQTVGEKFSCRDCEKITQPPAPFHVTPRGLFGPSFLAMLLFEKFGAHQPLNRYSRDRRGEHPVAHLRNWTGILQADAYAGYNALFLAARLPAPLTRALCWSHARRYFFELADVATQLKERRKKAPVISPLAVEAVRRIDAIFDIERTINGRSAQDRLVLRQEHSAPLAANLET